MQGTFFKTRNATRGAKSLKSFILMQYDLQNQMLKKYLVVKTLQTTRLNI